MNGKPANAKTWALFRKLQALAERGVDGEREVARRKLARLGARYDFTTPYSIAVSLGKQIRFAAPLEQIAAELEAVAPKCLAQERR